MNINFSTNRVSDNKWHLDLVTILVTVDNDDSTNFFVNCWFSRFCINHLVNNLCIFTWVAWCHTCLISLVTFHFRNKGHSSLSWIVRIICVSNGFNTWDWITFFVNGNNLTKFSVSDSLNLAVHSNILRSHTTFIGEVTVNQWCDYKVELSLIRFPFTCCKNVTCYRVKRQWTFPLCFLNTVCWQFSIAIFACIVNSVCHIFKVSILSWPFWSVWLVRIDWSSRFVCIVWIKVKCYTFEAYCPSLVNCAIQVKACTSWVTICYKDIAKVLIMFDTFSCWIVNCFARLTSQGNSFKGWTTCFITVYNTCFLVILNVNNLSIARQVTWCCRDYLSSVTWDSWQVLVNCNHLSWIVRIIDVGSVRYTCNWVTIFIDNDEFTKGLVSYCISCFWSIWSNCLTTCYSFIGKVAIHNRNLNCTVSVASFVPSHLTSRLVILTCKGIVRFHICSWSFIASTLEGNSLFGRLSHIVNDCYVNDTSIFTWIWWWCRDNFNSVARNAWKRLVDGNHLSRIIRIIRVGSCWYTWNWISIFIHSDKFTKGFVCHCVCCIWCIRSNCLTTCYSFIGIVTNNNWSLNCSISVSRFSPSCCISCRIFFTVEAKVILSVGSWCLRISTSVSHCLTCCFYDIFRVFFNDNVVTVTWS